MKKFTVVFMVVVILGLSFGSLIAKVKLRKPKVRKTFFTNAEVIIPCDNYRIETIAISLKTGEQYTILKDTFPYAGEGTKIKCHISISGKVE